MSHHPSLSVACIRRIARVRATRIVAIAVGSAALTFVLPSLGQTPPTGTAPAPTASLQPLPPPPPAPTQPPQVQWPPNTPPGYGTTTPGTRIPPGYAPPGYGPPPGYAPPGYGTQPVYPPQGRQPNAPYPYPYAPPNYGPATLPYVDGKPAPAGYHEDSKIRKGLVIGGAITFGTCYLFTLLAASVISEDNNNSWDNTKKDDSKALPLFIPALGPFIGLATLDPSSVGAGWLILDGLAQTAGLGMLIAGFTSPEKRYLRDDISKFEWKLSPVVTGSRTGLGVVGQF